MSKPIIIDYDSKSYKKQFQNNCQALPRNVTRYVVDLFPIFQWIHRYNVMWLIRDLIAGMTVGVVVVPQSMGYARLAGLPAEYGLYTAFVGLCVYCVFGTSKDISIGPTAVMSLLVGQIISQSSSSQWVAIPGPAIAATFSLLVGLSILAMGLLRLGILVELIPGPVIAGFMTGSAITITFSQLKSLTGISEIKTQDPAYLIVGQLFRYLPRAKLDVAFGLVGLVWLYGVQYGCTVLTRRYPRYAGAIFMFSIMRNGILVILGTIVAFLMNIGRDVSPIQILQAIPAGFQAMGVPPVNSTLIGMVAPSLPSGIIILILEHLAIAKSFGRLNNYTIRPSQEIVAIGFTNIISSFFGAYPSTGSFSRTAIASRSGVKTPLSGVFAGAVVLLALYVLTPAFYYIPDAILAAVVIHAVANLVSGPSYLVRLYKISLWDLATFVIAVGITFFTSVEYGIYVALGLSTVLLLGRIARPKLEVLGRIPLEPSGFLYLAHDHPALGQCVQSLPDGIVGIRIAESMTYPNASFVAEQVVGACKKITAAMAPSSNQRNSLLDRPWNEESCNSHHHAKPALFAVVFDMAGVHRIDASGAQSLCDAQHALAHYSGHPVDFHFAGILDPALRQALLVSGFGDQASIPCDTSIDGTDCESSESDDDDVVRSSKATKENEIEDMPAMPLPKDRYPCFHWSLDEAIRVAVDLRDGRQADRIEVAVVADPS